MCSTGVSRSPSGPGSSPELLNHKCVTLREIGYSGVMPVIATDELVGGAV